MIKTKILSIDPVNPQPEIIKEAAGLILAGEVVAFPTETVYGLGANAFDAHAVEKIFIAKGRPAHDPLIVHLAQASDLEKVSRKIDETVLRLGENFWPGPLTLVLPKAPEIPGNVTAGLDTVAVRVPDHAVALALIRASQTAIAAPSANIFSGVSPTTARHVLQDLDGRIPLIVDGGSTLIGVESTVLDCTSWPATILRPGGVPLEALQNFLDVVRVFEKNGRQESPVLSPGMLDKHYSPRAKVAFIALSDPQKYLPLLKQAIQRDLTAGSKTGALIVEEEREWFAQNFPQVNTFVLGRRLDLQHIASRLYAGLRALDEKGAERIYVHDFGGQGLGMAIRDRLMRAAEVVINGSIHEQQL